MRYMRKLALETTYILIPATPCVQMLFTGWMRYIQIIMYCISNSSFQFQCTSGVYMANILDPLCDAVNPDPTCCEVAEKYLKYCQTIKKFRKLSMFAREGRRYACSLQKRISFVL